MLRTTYDVLALRYRGSSCDHQVTSHLGVSANLRYRHKDGYSGIAEPREDFDVLDERVNRGRCESSLACLWLIKCLPLTSS